MLGLAAAALLTALPALADNYLPAWLLVVSSVLRA